MKWILFTLVLFTLLVRNSNAQIWQQLSLPTTQDIVSSSFINDLEGWIGTKNTGGPVVIFHTDDGGVTWNTDVITGALGGSTYLEFVNAQTGYAVVSGEAFKTTDGTTWFELNLPATPYYEPYFLDTDTGFIGSNNHRIYKTTDGGLTWTTSFLKKTNSTYRISFFDESHGAVCENDGNIDGTTDGGATWFSIDDGGAYTYFHSVTYTPSGDLYYTGYTDGVLEYTVEIFGPNDYGGKDIGDLLDILAYSDDIIYAAGEDGQLVFTEDGSQTWNKLNLCELFNLSPEDLLVLDGFETIYVFGKAGRGFKDPAQCTLLPEFIYTINELDVQFTDQTVNATYWNWHFGDGTTSTLQNPLHTYPVDGTYNACLLSSNDSCESGYSGCQDVFLCASNTSQNIAGTLDSSFDGDGIASIEFDGLYNECRSLVVQPDHKVIGMNNGHGAEIIRYQTNGLPDSTFGNDGVIEFGEDYGLDEIKLNSSGQILVATSGSQLFQFNPDGTPDLAFGTNGVATIDFAGNLIAMEVLPDDKLLLLTSYSELGYQFTQIMKLNSDGSIDSSFSSDGIAELVSADFYFHEEQVGSLAVQSDGKMVFAGTIHPPFNKLAVARLNADGTMDATFDSDGIAETDLSTEASKDYATDLALQPDGKIVVVGNSSLSMAVVRYNTDGSLDGGFGNNGILELQPDNEDAMANAVVLQPDGKILVCGTTLFYTSPDKSTLIKLNPDGTYDTSFGNNGVLRTSLDCTNTHGFDVALDDDKIYVGAEGSQNNNEQFCIFRYNNEDVSEQCAEPSDLNVTNISSTSATLHWNVVAGAEYYRAAYRKNGTNKWNSAKDPMGGFKIYQNFVETGVLEPATTYQWKVAAFCDGVLLPKKGVSGPEFTTAEEKITLEEKATLTSMSVYPNPSTGNITVTYDGSYTGSLQLTIYDLPGKQLLTKIEKAEKE